MLATRHNDGGDVVLGGESEDFTIFADEISFKRIYSALCLLTVISKII